ncbi:MAG: hypothetical protein D3916_09625 [Candidatus Electrothrix sp. MAN1_4]|nr:hypothetical protein [Candidatus Electrothrix sp. MAN1_4]
MPYGKFESIEQVADRFGIKVTRSSFLETKDIAVDEFFLTRMSRAVLKAFPPARRDQTYK